MNFVFLKKVLFLYLLDAKVTKRHIQDPQNKKTIKRYKMLTLFNSYWERRWVRFLYGCGAFLRLYVRNEC